MLDRIQRLEAAVFSRANRALEPGNADTQLDGIETRHAVSNLYRTCQATLHITESELGRVSCSAIYFIFVAFTLYLYHFYFSR